MTRLLPFAIAAALAAVPVVAFAQEQDSPPAASQAPKAKAAKPKAAAAAAGSRERRPGELEGWDVKTAAPKPSKRGLPPGVISEKAAPDGGLPLPSVRERDNAPPVGFGPSGNMGGMFRF
jgi:hypothetical protein